MATSPAETAPVPTFTDAETAGGDELRACSVAHLAQLLTDSLKAAAAETEKQEGLAGREAKASRNLAARYFSIADRVHEYIGYKLEDPYEA